MRIQLKRIAVFGPVPQGLCLRLAKSWPLHRGIQFLALITPSK
jgi:hypothetical protein